MKQTRSAITAALAVILFALLQAQPAEAVSSRSWRLRDRADFEKAELTTISMSQDGTLSLAPPLNLLYEADQPFLWALAQDGDGNIYAAGGNDGIIYRIDESGEGREFFRTQEPEVHALAIDSKGRIYAGTAPGGRIYRIDPDGADAFTFETEEEYVWSMVFDDAGNLYAATGTEGRILKIDSSGIAELFFDSAETHIRTLVRERDGTLLAGSDGHGLIFRIEDDGSAFVVYDTPADEVVTLVTGGDGTIYAAIVSGSGRGRRSHSATPAGKAAKGGPKKDEDNSSSPAGGAPPGRRQKAEPRVRVSTEAKVLAISSDGYGRAIWEGKDEVILSLAVTSDERLLMGSSVDGRIYALDRVREEIGIIAEAPSSQVTALAGRVGAGGGEEILIAGSNLGTVALLRPGHAPSGIVESPPLDAQSFARWGRITWKADVPRGTGVTIQGRSGNTEDPDRTWSEWGEEMVDPASAVLDLPAARFVQWRAILETDDPGLTPVLHEVSVSYLQRNLPPTIAEVSINHSGPGRPRGGAARAAGGPRQSPKSSSTPAKREAGRGSSGNGAPGKLPAVRYITWNAEDPNNDQLIYRVEYRGVDETTWKLLQDELQQNFIKLDTTAMPDGTYLIRVTASDAPSNAPDQVLSAVRVSSHFDVDNTPPRVESLKAEVDSPAVRVQFTVSDTFSTVRRTAYAVDAGDWVEAHPDDGMNDDLDEQYELTVEDLPPGEHSIVVRATDAAGNVGAGKAIVEIP